MEFLFMVGVVAIWAILLVIDLRLYHQKAVGRFVALTVIVELIYFIGLFLALVTFSVDNSSFVIAGSIAATLILLALRYLVTPIIPEQGSSLLLVCCSFFGIALASLSFSLYGFSYRAVFDLAIWPLGFLCGWLFFAPLKSRK